MQKLNIRVSLKKIQFRKSNKSTDSWMASNISIVGDHSPCLPGEDDYFFQIREGKFRVGGTTGGETCSVVLGKDW